MAVLNKRAVVSAIELYGVSSIRLPKVLGESFDQLIKSLFSNGEQGFLYDPNDLSTMFQDAAGTVPVTAVGQPVGLIRDKSGRNNHARQTTSASRPILRQNATTGAYYLEFDGSDDFLVTNSIDFTVTDKVSLFAGVRKLSDAAIASFIKLGVGVPAGRFEVLLPPTFSSTHYELSIDAAWAQFNFNAAPVSGVLVGFLDRSAPSSASGEISSRLNGAVNPIVVNSGTNSTGKFGNLPIYIGRRDGTAYPFNGHIYSLIGIGRLSTGDEIIAIEKELAKRVGVTLNV